MYKKNYIIFIVLLLFLSIGLVSAWTPTGDINLRNFYNIDNGKNIESINLSGNLSWDNLRDYPISCPEGYAITQLNDSIICTAFILSSEEPNLNVNSSLSLNSSEGYINEMNYTWFDLVSNILTIDLTQLTSFINTWLGTKTTDDLTEGSTNKYDNQSWNENYLLNKENTFTENQTFLNYTCYNADCSARIYHNGSGIMIES